MILFMSYYLLFPNLKNSICNRTSYPNRVGLTTFPFQTYKGSLNFPNLGLFFNIGVLGGWGIVGFWILGFIGLGAGLLKAICSGFFSLGRFGFRGPRQGLNRVARKGGGEWPARRGGDLGSPRKPAGPAPGNRGQPVKARSRPKKQIKLDWNRAENGGRDPSFAPCGRGRAAPEFRVQGRARRGR